MISGYDEGLHKVVLKGALQKNLIGYNIMPVYKSLLKKKHQVMMKEEIQHFLR